MAIDLLTTDFRIDEAHVIGTGPNGLAHLDKLKGAKFVIVVNRAVDYDWIPRHLWLCDDGTLPQKEWFQKCVRYYIPGNIARTTIPVILQPSPTPVFSEGKLLDAYPDVPYYVRHSSGFYTDPQGCHPGVLRGGTSVGGKATQLAYHLGAKRIVLCGIDMKGKAYANDPEGHGCNANLRAGGVWAQRDNFNRLIQWLKGQGVVVVSLSPTALDIPII